MLVGVPCASGRYEYGRKELVVSLCASIPVMKMSRFFAYRYTVHIAAHLGKEKRKRPEIAHLRKVMRKDRENAHLRKVEEDGEVGQGRAVERVSRGG